MKYLSKLFIPPRSEHLVRIVYQKDDWQEINLEIVPLKEHWPTQAPNELVHIHMSKLPAFLRLHIIEL